MKEKNPYNQATPLSKMPVGTKVEILELLLTGLPRRRMLDLGLIPGTMIHILRKSPLGDPIAYRIRGATIALRKEEADLIQVKPMN